LPATPHSDSTCRSHPTETTPHRNTNPEANVLEEINIFALQRRHAFVRYVKVLRLRDTLGRGATGTVYHSVGIHTDQQLAAEESLIKQNSPDELAAVRSELRRLGELRRPYIVEYFGCRVEVVEDHYVPIFRTLSSPPTPARWSRGEAAGGEACRRTTAHRLTWFLRSR
jgi:serine/threonine protein kinase